ncbi:unnamed protein product [Parnassius apollo]|uniref:(apollo) hypothetical protein n=1 Tax=Parnassius apollo TaxID=110799 RepID=A0A8S3XEW8_PARAO|nr:unnamed protein product [Parnassius apollo]
MSTQRTPPNTLNLSGNKTRIQLHGTDPNPNILMESDNECSTLTRRQKRKIPEPSEESSLMQELRRMFNDFNKQQNQKIETLITSINEIKQQNVEIRESISFLSAKYDDVLKELEHIKEENNLKTCLINSLEQKI